MNFVLKKSNLKPFVQNQFLKSQETAIVPGFFGFSTSGSSSWISTCRRVGEGTAEVTWEGGIDPVTEGSKEAVAEKGNDLDAEGSLEFICPGLWSWLVNQPPTNVPPPRNKGLIRPY